MKNDILINLEKLSQQQVFVNPEKLMQANLKDCYLSAIGGRVVSDDFSPENIEIRKICLEAIGEGSIVTFGNPKNRSRIEYAKKAFSDNHLWALRTFHLTFLYVNSPEQFRLDMAYCRRFHLSWQEKVNDGIPIIFTAQGSLRDWKKFLSHSDDLSFSSDTRIWMKTTKNVICNFLPELF